MRHVSRRALLRAAGAGAAVLPFAPVLGSRAQDPVPKKRLVFFYTANGTVHESWLPSMGPGGLELSPILEPLARHAHRLTVVDGLDYSVADIGPQQGHFGGMNAALTGMPGRIIDPADPAQHTVATGVSLDQVIAEHIGSSTPFRSIECGIQVDMYSPAVSTLSYDRSATPMPPENNPTRVFDRVFGAFVPEDRTRAERERASRLGVLDFARGDLARLRGRLGAEERMRLDAHEAHFDSIERRLRIAELACSAPADPGPVDEWNNDAIPDLGRLQMDLVLAALACDQTRVATIQYGRAGAQHRFTWLGFAEDPDLGPMDDTVGHHALAHDEATPASRAKLVELNRWYAGELAHFLDGLAAMPEGEGSMLDHTLVCWMNEMGTGSHSLEDTPWVLAGNVGGALTTGRVHSFPREPHNRLLVTIARAFGLDLEGFGHADFARPALSGLLA